MNPSVKPATEDLRRGVSQWLIYVLLACIVIIAAIVRIHGVSAYHLNADEMLHLHIIRGNSFGEVLRFSLNETHPPLYWLLLYGWSQISDAPAFLRGLALLFGLLLIPLYYSIGYYLGGRIAGICNAVLVAFGYGSIVESNILRGYTCLLFFLSVGFLALLKWRKTGSSTALLWYAAAGLLAGLTDFTAVFALFCMGSCEGLSLVMNGTGTRRRLIAWLLVHVLLTTVLTTLYWQWLPTLSAYGAAGQHLFLSPPVVKRALISPLLMLCYLLPYQGGGAYALTLYIAVITALVWAARRERRQRPLLALMGMAYLTMMLLYASGLYHIGMYLPGGRNNLWLLPFTVPVLGWSAAICLNAMPKVKSVIREHILKQPYIALVLLMCGLSFGTGERFFDSEYMLTVRASDELATYLGGLGANDLIVTDKLAAFMLAPDTYNPYGRMRYGVWENGAMAMTIPYGHSHLLMDMQHMRFDSQTALTSLYNDISAQDQFKKADRVVFADYSWRAWAIDRLIDCPLLDKQVVSFPKEGNSEVMLLIVSRDAFERQVVATDGKARACLQRKTP